MLTMLATKNRAVLCGPRRTIASSPQDTRISEGEVVFLKMCYSGVSCRIGNVL